MKTRDLVAMLERADPTGELQVCVGGHDIHFADAVPGHFDGTYEVLVRDPGRRGYDIVGAEIRSSGMKIVLRTLPVELALLDDPAMPVAFDGEHARLHGGERVARWRRVAVDS